MDSEDNESGVYGSCMFDTDVFDDDEPWCVFNVMLIEIAGKASRSIDFETVYVSSPNLTRVLAGWKLFWHNYYYMWPFCAPSPLSLLGTPNLLLLEQRHAMDVFQSVLAVRPRAWKLESIVRGSAYAQVTQRSDRLPKTQHKSAYKCYAVLVTARW